MNAFTIFVNSVNVNKYVDAESFDGFRSRAEGESIWDFFSDSISFELDRSWLDDSAVPVTNIESIQKYLVELHYYGIKVFTGSVTSADYDHFTETLTIDADSIFKIVCGISVSSWSSSGENHDLRRIAKGVVNNAYIYLLENDYPFQVSFFPLIDVVDFSFYRSLIPEKLAEAYIITEAKDLPNLTNKHLWAIVLIESTYFMVFYYAVGGTIPVYWLVPITESGPDYDAAFVKSELEMPATGEIDPAITEIIKENIALSDFSYMGLLAEIENYYYAIIKVNEKKHIVKVTVDQEDVFMYNYEGTTLGQVLKDAAIMTNSIVNMGPAGILYFQSRDGMTALSRKHPENLKSRLVKHTEEVPLPEAFIIKEDVKDDLLAYYADFLQGDFKRFQAVFQPEELLNENPLMLKNLPVDYKNLDLGLIRAADFQEHFIDIETEKKSG